MKIIALLSCLLGALNPALSLAQGSPETIPKVPVMLYISSSDCTFCHRFENDVLNPLIKSGVYTNTIIIRKIVLDSPEPVVNFKGEFVSPKTLAHSYEVTVTPTLLFVDHNGKELVPRIIGYQKSDFFGYYLEQAVNKAAALLAES